MRQLLPDIKSLHANRTHDSRVPLPASVANYAGAVSEMHLKSSIQHIETIIGILTDRDKVVKMHEWMKLVRTARYARVTSDTEDYNTLVAELSFIDTTFSDWLALIDELPAASVSLPPAAMRVSNARSSHDVLIARIASLWSCDVPSIGEHTLGLTSCDTSLGYRVTSAPVSNFDCLLYCIAAIHHTPVASLKAHIIASANHFYETARVVTHAVLYALEESGCSVAGLNRKAVLSRYARYIRGATNKCSHDITLLNYHSAIPASTTAYNSVRVYTVHWSRGMVHACGDRAPTEALGLIPARSAYVALLAKHFHLIWRHDDSGATVTFENDDAHALLKDGLRLAAPAAPIRMSKHDVIECS